MDVTLQKTRIIFENYTPGEKIALEDLVGTMNKSFLYEDPDKNRICIPTGMVDSVLKKFPYIKIKDESKQYWPYEKIAPVTNNATPLNKLQEDFINFVLKEAKTQTKVAGILSPGTGKQQPNSTLIPTPTGWITMGKLKIGDYVFGSNGKPVEVIGVYPQKNKEVYEITFSDKRTVRCGPEHLWEVIINDEDRKAVLTTKEMLEDYKIHITPNHIRYRYRVPFISNPVEYNWQYIPVDPYVLGALIGNGCLMDYPLTISSGDDFVPKKIASIYKWYEKKSCDKNYNYVFYRYADRKQDRIHTEELLYEVPELMNRGDSKLIPDCYMYNTLDIRLRLLQGLMDTDGAINSKRPYIIRYTSTSKILLEQIQQLIESLGFYATLSIDNRTEKYRNGFCGNLNIHVPNKFKEYLFTHPKKLLKAKEAADVPDKIFKFKGLLITDIKKVNDEQCTCISVDSKDKLYLTDHFIPTHNTFMSCYCATHVGGRTLIIVPMSALKSQWAKDTLIDMFNVSPDRVINVMKPSDFVNVNADFVVITHAALASLNKKYDLEALIKANKFQIKIYDEVQLWFHNIIKVDGCSNIANNWYLTGTHGRSGDEENRLYQEMFHDLAFFREKQKNPTLFNRKPGNIYGMKPWTIIEMDYIKSGLTPEEVKSVSKSIQYAERAGKWMRYGLSSSAYTNLVIPPDGSMTPFLSKLLQIIKKAEDKVKYGSTLILVGTLSAVEIVAQKCREMFPDKKVGTYHSKKTVEEKAKVKAESDIIVSTVASCGTGFDVKGLSKLIVAQPYKSWIYADQVSGRLRRRPDGKDTYMWEIVDESVPQLSKWAMIRAEVYKKKSKFFKVVDM